MGLELRVDYIRYLQNGLELVVWTDVGASGTSPGHATLGAVCISALRYRYTLVLFFTLWTSTPRAVLLLLQL